jgi:hypothetical protein
MGKMTGTIAGKTKTALLLSSVATVILMGAAANAQTQSQGQAPAQDHATTSTVKTDPLSLGKPDIGANDAATTDKNSGKAAEHQAAEQQKDKAAEQKTAEQKSAEKKDTAKDAVKDAQTKPEVKPEPKSEQAKSEPAKAEPAKAETPKTESAKTETKPDAAKPEAKTAANIRLGTDASGRVAINAAQERQIHTALTHHHAQPVTGVDITVKTGAVVPGDIRLEDVPSDIVEVFPQFRDYKYFTTREDVVIVDQNSKAIVALVPAKLTVTAAKPVAKSAAKSKALAKTVTKPAVRTVTRDTVTRTTATAPYEAPQYQTPYDTRTVITRVAPRPEPMTIDRDLTIGPGGPDDVVVQRAPPPVYRQAVVPAYPYRTYRTLPPDDRSAVVIERRRAPAYYDDDDEY